MRKRVPQEIEKKYLNFISEIPVLLSELKKIMTEHNFINEEDWDFQLTTINNFERMYLDILDNKIVLNISKERMKNIFYAYIGEAVIHHVGGHWELGTLKSDDAYGTPIIINWGKKNSDHVRISPDVWEYLLAKHRKLGEIASRIDQMKRTA